MRFYLGTHKPHWLKRTSAALFVSRRALQLLRTMPRALGPWALDSGGFTEVALRGGWRLSVQEYARAVERYRDEIGHLAWAAPMDWMCEPAALRATGRSVGQHQLATVDNFGELRARLGDLVIPVLQGWEPRQYLANVEDYARAGYDLRLEPLVGVGSICRRQDTEEAAEILWSLSRLGLRLHAFGLKAGGLALAADAIASADSMAWSMRARRSAPLPGHTHRACSNCLPYALAWRSKIERLIDGPMQQRLAV